MSTPLPTRIRTLLHHPIFRSTPRVPSSTSRTFTNTSSRKTPSPLPKTTRWMQFAFVDSRASRTCRKFTSTAPATGQGFIRRLWESPIGMKTVHFWAPVMKWAIVIAGISDLYRPAEKLSLTQNLALTATGIIWTRWCFVIRPRNVLLATVNFFLGMVGIVQVSRILMYQQSQKGKGVGEQVGEVVDDAKDKVKTVVGK